MQKSEAFEPDSMPAEEPDMTWKQTTGKEQEL